FYHVEGVDSDGSCVSRASNCVSTTPIIYRVSDAEAAVLDVCATGGPGDGDGVLDPGESAIFPVTVENDGNVPLTSVAGVLAMSTPGAAVIDPDGLWPDLDPGSEAESLPNHFGLDLADTVDCGTTLDADLTVSYDGGGNSTPVPTLVGAVQEATWMSEDFTTGIPPDWTVIDGGSGGGDASTWTDANPGDRNIGPPFDDFFVIADSWYAGSSAPLDEQLITPSFDASSCLELELEFSNQFRTWGVGLEERGDVDVSYDDGANWSNLLRLAADDGFPDENTKTLSANTSGLPDASAIRFRFHYYNALGERWWAIDNVNVRCKFAVCTACGPAGPAPGEPGGLKIWKNESNLELQWAPASIGCGATEYSVYRGNLTAIRAGTYAHDTVLSCGTGGTVFSTPLDNPYLGQRDYFLVVAGNGSAEGSYGRDSEGVERPVSGAPCQNIQNAEDCP
ncbi:MAG: choice-of-anchor J domain-containing protein, partial [Acidobacteriota bacterium]|nr:choice-of-anchor J domain-containing protein [Acidobacteriota bacterium]